MDRFEELRTFVRVAETLSVTRAAAQLGFAPSAVSRRINELEARIGTQLLQRTTRRIALTDAGRAFHARALRILADLDEAESEAADDRTALSGTLRLTVPMSLALSALNSILSDFLAAHPQLVVDIDLSDRIVDLVADGIDLAIRVGSLADSTLIARRLSTVRHVLAASPDFLARNGTPATPDDLRGAPGLCYSNVRDPDVWSYADASGRVVPIAVTPRLLASNGDTLREAAIAGLGYTFAPSFILHRHIADGLLVHVLAGFDWRSTGIYAVYPPTRHLSARARAFVDFLAERIGPVPFWEKCLGTPGGGLTAT